jgi:hypothetical protein
MKIKYTWRADGEANFYVISSHIDGKENWFARVQLNGEFTARQQCAIINAWCAALSE